MSTSATALRRRSTFASVPITSTSKPGTPRSRISSSVWVTPCIPPLAVPGEGGGDAVPPADAVGDDRDAHRLVLARRELALLAAEARGGGRVGEGGGARGEGGAGRGLPRAG